MKWSLFALVGFGKVIQDKEKLNVIVTDIEDEDLYSRSLIYC